MSLKDFIFSLTCSPHVSHAWLSAIDGCAPIAHHLVQRSSLIQSFNGLVLLGKDTAWIHCFSWFSLHPPKQRVLWSSFFNVLFNQFVEGCWNDAATAEFPRVLDLINQRSSVILVQYFSRSISKLLALGIAVRPAVSWNAIGDLYAIWELQLHSAANMKSNSANRTSELHL